MSITGNPRQPAAQSPTRRQLDELDVLLKRMQELPVHESAPEPLDQSEGVPSCSVRTDLPSSVPSPNFSLEISSAGHSIPRTTETIASSTPVPHAEIEPLPVDRRELPPPVTGMRSLEERIKLPLPPMSQRHPSLMSLGEKYKSDAESALKVNNPRAASELPVTASWLRPLLWANWIFDCGTRALGPPGRLLRGDTGRFILGIAGIVLVAGSVAFCVLTRMGWFW